MTKRKRAPKRPRGPKLLSEEQLRRLTVVYGCLEQIPLAPNTKADDFYHKYKDQQDALVEERRRKRFEQAGN